MSLFLGTFNNDDYSRVTDLSTDGKVAVGYSKDSSKEESVDSKVSVPFIHYENEIGMLSVPQLLKGQLPEDDLKSSQLKISGNGTIVTPHGLSFWYAYIPRYDVFKDEGIELLPQKDKQQS